MTRPALPDFTVADDAGTLVRPPSRHMDVLDHLALAMDRIIAASLGAPLADDDDTPSIARLDIEAVRGTGGAR